MLREDSDALACDLAETYRIYDMRQFSPVRIAVFASGLGENSRIKTRLAGQDYCLHSLLMAGMLDSLNLLVWALMKKGVPAPESILARMKKGPEKKAESSYETFSSGEDFEMAWANIAGGD